MLILHSVWLPLSSQAIQSLQRRVYKLYAIFYSLKAHSFPEMRYSPTALELPNEEGTRLSAEFVAFLKDEG